MGGALLAAVAVGGWTLGRADVSHAVTPPAPAASAPSSFADIISRVEPAVVSIDVERKAELDPTALWGSSPFLFDSPQDGDDDTPFGFSFRPPFGGQRPGDRATPKVEASGSGFFISAKGYIVTNNHVVEKAEKITVRTNDDKSLTARLVGRDPSTDLAVIKVEGAGYPFVDFENQSKPRVGDWVIAVGNPFNLGGSATAGIVSALSRPKVSGNGYVDYMQIDAPINRGNSGGPTFDVYGRVVGVNTAIFSPSGGSVGIGFDIPADVAQSISRQLIAHGKVTRGYIGASIQDVTREIAESLGVAPDAGALVADVTPSGPSAQAGLGSGDVIVSVNGHRVTSASDLTRQVALAHPGETLRLKVRRDGAEREIMVRSGARPSEAALARLDDQRTADAAPPSEPLGLRLAANPNGGVTIKGVATGSDASGKGLRPGDVILRAGLQRTDSPADFEAAVENARHSGRQFLSVLVDHGGRRRFMALDLADKMG
ncbi:Do family serine endopeptidase [Phenylobacterium montanum]|nr:Do family serine endopeptidase [Caulobacter sp. S6]